MGKVHFAIIPTTSLGLTVYWTLWVKDDCHGPIYHSRYETCVVNLDPEKNKFQEELIAISNCFQVRRVRQFRVHGLHGTKKRGKFIV